MIKITEQSKTKSVKTERLISRTREELQMAAKGENVKILKDGEFLLL